MRMRTVFAVTIAVDVAVAVAVAACGALESYALAVDPSSLTIEQSTTAVTTVAVDRDEGFTEPVVLALEGAPAGVTGVFADAAVAGAETHLVVAVAASVPTGTYAVAIRGSAGGVVRTAPLVVTVTPRGFDLVALPGTTYVATGSTEVVLVGVERSASFVEPVDLALHDAPVGVTGTFDPNPSTGDASTLTLAVDGAVVAGSYPLSIRGSTGTGYGATTEFTLVVTEPDAAGFSLALDTSGLALARGEAGEVVVTIVPAGGFADPVALSAALKPTAEHIAVSFVPASAGASSVMTLVIGQGVPPRTYLVEVRGLSGALRDTVPLALTVTSAD